MKYRHRRTGRQTPSYLVLALAQLNIFRKHAAQQMRRNSRMLLMSVNALSRSAGVKIDWCSWVFLVRDDLSRFGIVVRDLILRADCFAFL